MRTNVDQGDGDGRTLTILQRLGSTLMLMSFALIVVAWQLAPPATFVYAAMLAAHVLLYSGLLLKSLVDLRVQRPFSWVRLVTVLSIGFFYAAIGPILMSAVAAAHTTRLHLSGSEYRSSQH